MEDYRSVDERLLSELGRNPTLEEIAEAMHVSVEEAAAVSKNLEAARSLAQAKQPAQPQQEEAEDNQAVEDTAYFQMRQRVADLLSELDEQEQKLLSLRFGLEGGKPLTAEQVGQRLGLTPEEAVRMEAAALAKLRQQ
jgi:RNA polymerase primary sigma factor